MLEHGEGINDDGIGTKSSISGICFSNTGFLKKSGTGHSSSLSCLATGMLGLCGFKLGYPPKIGGFMMIHSSRGSFSLCGFGEPLIFTRRCCSQVQSSSAAGALS